MIKYGYRIIGHLFNAVCAKWFVTSTSTTVVMGNDSVARGKNETLHIPHVLVCAKTLNHQYWRR